MAEDAQPRTSALEWIAAAIGLALLLSVFAVIGREALRGTSDQAPALSVVALRTVPLAQGFRVEFEARNSGGATAAAVEVEGALALPGKRPVTSTATLDYVAGHAVTRGGLFFAEDPRRGTLQLRALGYQQP
jgi:uncharacterized protein (TIGR02588 family)